MRIVHYVLSLLLLVNLACNAIRPGSQHTPTPDQTEGGVAADQHRQRSHTLTAAVHNVKGACIFIGACTTALGLGAVGGVAFGVGARSALEKIDHAPRESMRDMILGTAGLSASWKTSEKVFDSGMRRASLHFDAARRANGRN
jgi:hypothetical protein